MKIGACILLGIRYLFGKRSDRGNSQLFGSVLTIGLSLVPLIVVLVVADGMIEGITARYVEIRSYHMQSLRVSNPRFSSLIPYSSEEISEIAAGIESIPGVIRATPERRGAGLVSSGKNRIGIEIRAVSPDLYDGDPGLKEYLSFKEGAFDLSDSNSILIGTGTANELEAKTGDRITLITMRSMAGRPLIPRLEQFTISGVFSTGYQELDSLWVYIPLEKGRRILDSSTAQDLIGIKSDLKPDNLGELRRKIEGIVPVDFKTVTWYDLEEAQYKSFQDTRITLLFIMALIVCVAAINISSSLVMLVIEKRQEIGILKSIGAGPSGIELAFITTGFMTGVFGMILGMTVGLLAAININGIIYGIESILNGTAAFIRFVASPFTSFEETNIRILNPAFYLERIPIHLDIMSLAIIGIFTIAASALASYLPARSAGKIRPLDVLRKH